MDLFEGILLNTPFNRYMRLFNCYIPYINYEKSKWTRRVIAKFFFIHWQL